MSSPLCVASLPWPEFDLHFLMTVHVDIFHELLVICRFLEKYLFRSSLFIFLLLSCESLLCIPGTNPSLKIFSSIFVVDWLHHGAPRTFHKSLGTTLVPQGCEPSKGLSPSSPVSWQCLVIPPGVRRWRPAGPSSTTSLLPWEGVRQFLGHFSGSSEVGGFLQLLLPPASPPPKIESFELLVNYSTL